MIMGITCRGAGCLGHYELQGYWSTDRHTAAISYYFLLTAETGRPVVSIATLDYCPLLSGVIRLRLCKLKKLLM